MKIDIFNHFLPERFFAEFIKGSGAGGALKRVQNVPTLVDLDARFRLMDEFGELRQVLSLASPPLEVLAAPGQSSYLARVGNDGLAELVARYPDRFVAFVVSLPMDDPDAALAEMERALDGLHAKGVQLYTNVLGKPLDAPEFQPLFEEAARRDVGIWLHPARYADFPDYRSEDQSRYEIWWTLGWSYETSVAMARLVFSGLFDRFPDIKIITHHMGAMIPYFEGRVGYGWDQLGTRTTDEDYTGLLRSMKQRPVDYFRRFYADTALFGALAATRCGLDFFGVYHVVFATDIPFEPTPGLYCRETIRVIEQLDLPPDQKDQIYRRNAERLLNIAGA